MNGPTRAYSNIIVGEYGEVSSKGILKRRISKAWAGSDCQHKFVEIEKNSFLVFVDDLTETMYTRWLWQIFSVKRRVQDFFCQGN